MKKNILLMLVALTARICQAGTREELSVSTIPDSLMRGAHKVVRSEDFDLSVSSPSKIEYTLHKVVTILDEMGADELTISEGYDKFTRIREIRIVIYDRNGKQLNRHTISDMQDYAAGGAFFSDYRMKYLKTAGGVYPVTADITTTIQRDGVLDYPDWIIQEPGEAIEHSTCQVTMPPSMYLRWKAYHIDIHPEIDDSHKTYKWSVAGLRAQPPMSGTWSYRHYMPHIDFSPTDFEIDGYKGSMESWEKFSAAVANMWKHQRNLSDTVKAELRQMVKDARNDHEKIAILYSYLQKNFHYVSIQMGTGGIIPFDAQSVHSERYGDCKALSNYLCAALEAAGVSSTPILINAGSREAAIDSSFSANKFNHVILCAMADGQQEWLECTSSAMDAGHLGTFTENRYGLTVAAQGGKLVRTPASAAESNPFFISNDVRIGANGAASISTHISLGGEYRQESCTELYMGKETEQAAYLFKRLCLRQPDELALGTPIDSEARIAMTFTGAGEHVYDFRNGPKMYLSSTRLSKWYS
ncbi:MAG: DUF3857 domain-containing protein, partial [Bacteroidetes bacterium]|nr:DUF3857 domain-containing protein [Bacteroidota bacterium]